MYQLTTQQTGSWNVWNAWNAHSLYQAKVAVKTGLPPLGRVLTDNEDSTDGQWQALLVLQARVQHAIPATTPTTGTVRKKSQYQLTQHILFQLRCTLGRRAGARVMCGWWGLLDSNLACGVGNDGKLDCHLQPAHITG